MPKETEIIWSPTALGHLQAIYGYILPDSPAAALDVHEEIEHTAGLLKDNPRLGHPGRVADTRELVVSAYRNDILFYEIEGRRVHILAVMHGIGGNGRRVSAVGVAYDGHVQPQSPVKRLIDQGRAYTPEGGD